MIRPPLPASAIIAAICFEEGVSVRVMRDPALVSTRRDRRVRTRIWRKLYEQEDGGYRMFSQREIASWFGVTPQAVTYAIKGDADKRVVNVKRARRRAGKSLGVTPTSGLPGSET